MKYERLTTVDTPSAIVTEDGTDFVWTRTRDAAGGRALSPPPADMLYHGKVRGNDSGRSKRRAWRKMQETRNMHGPVKPAKRPKKRTPKSEKPAIIREGEWSIDLCHIETGQHITIKLFAKGSEIAAKMARESFPGFKVETVNESE